MAERSRNRLRVFPAGTEVVGHMSGGSFRLQSDQTLPVLETFTVHGVRRNDGAIQRGVTAYLHSRTGERNSGQLVTHYYYEEFQ